MSTAADRPRAPLIHELAGSAMASQNPSLPSKPEKPVSKNTGKYGFFSMEEHQFHAEVRRPSMQEPASKKLSAPLPSKAWRKKSARMSFCRTFTPPKESI